MVFIQSYRIKRAAQMLKGKTGNVSEIAMEVGFSTNSYFIKVFKTHFGMTPNEYMNKEE